MNSALPPTRTPSELTVTIGCNVEGTQVKKGWIAHFVPVPLGKRVKPTGLPVMLMRDSIGVPLLLSYAAYVTDHEGKDPHKNGAGVFACRLAYQPMDSDPFLPAKSIGEMPAATRVPSRYQVPS